MPEKSQTLAIDVGGTNTRARFADAEKHQKVSSISELRDFIIDITKQRKPGRCAIGFGGPVVSRTEAQMTNWPDNPVIHISDLNDWGLPKGSTLMLNDMEAGAYGVISLRENDSVCLYDPEKTNMEIHSLNKILLAPGTGLGTIGIVAVRTNAGEICEEPIASEIQHSAAFPLDPTHGAVIAWLSEKKGAGWMPSWEDFVSGRGLVNIYDGLLALSHSAAPVAALEPSDRAAWIAVNAVAKSDAGCEKALDIYYRCMGKVAQILALTYQPFGGIYISGESTIRNVSFIERSRFISALQENSKLRQLLERFPVYVIAQKDLNIRGALWACRERIHLSHDWR
jgi:glucokinase